ncbi:MAG: FtsX-like permease family protein, partial [Candidatus Methylomirabilis sp.]|nr:FtsX-like permease family protein [Deltaproteobacteria bacterium]
AAFNIVTTLIMVVMDKRRDIAVLKTLGAGEPAIRRIFALEGLMIGLLGTALGAGAGVAACMALERWEIVRLPSDVFYNLNLPVSLAWSDVGAILLAAVAITVLATLYPSRQAARFMPADVFRKP